jgi:septum formation protein
LKFLVVPSDYEEDMTLELSPEKLAKVLSMGKAEAVAKKYKDAIIIGGDSFVVYRNHIWGKPHTPRRAKAMLRKLSGKVNTVITGFSIIDTRTGKRISRAVECRILLRKMTDHEIDAYIKTGEPLGRAGGYSAQERGSIFVKKIEGSFSAAVGLPVYELLQELKKFGVEVF